MKLKDLEVGGVYAFGSPNARYNYPKQVRVLKIGVYGNPPRTQRYKFQSTHPNHVEFEVVRISDTLDRSFEVQLLLNGEIKHYPRDIEEANGPSVLRAAASFFQRRWDEHLVAEEKTDAYRRKQTEAANARKVRQVVVLKRLEAFGVTTVDYYDNIRLTIEDVETLMDLLEAKS